MVLKCVRCGLRQQMGPDGAYVYDDYYMYGGGYMMGLEMGLMLSVMGAADCAYADPMYGDYYGGDEGFAADGGFGFACCPYSDFGRTSRNPITDPGVSETPRPPATQPVSEKPPQTRAFG